mgnify:CR=1 FL=1
MTLMLALLLAAGPAAAGPTEPGKGTPPEAKPDPIICETVGELGSRIRGHKVCMHRSEWEAQRQSNRSMIERTQVERGNNGGQ